METPWLDDNFNRLPTYRNEADQLDSGDGLFSMETYFGFANLESPEINEDGIIDIKDLQIVSAAWGSKPGDPNWNPLADLDNDSDVDVHDLYFVSRNYGKYYSDPPSPVSKKTILFTYPTLIAKRKGETFTVNVVLYNVEDLHGWEFKLYWSNEILKCTQAEIHVPEIWGEKIFEAAPGLENDFNATHGRY